MSSSRISSLAAVLAGVLCFNAAIEQSYARPAEKNYVRVRLQPTRYNVPAVGFAVLQPAKDKTGVEVQVSNVPDDVTLPVHLYTYLYEGSCASRASRPRYMVDRVTTALNQGLSPGMISVEGRVRLRYEQLRSGRYAVSVQLSSADGGREIFCGDVAAS